MDHGEGVKKLVMCKPNRETWGKDKVANPYLDESLQNLKKAHFYYLVTLPQVYYDSHNKLHASKIIYLCKN